jgi:RNA polymerase sigma-70 factor (ECF subfamily)
MNWDAGPDPASLLSRAAAGDAEAWGALLARHQDRLTSVICFRLDPRLRGRVDAADVLQEVFVAATARRGEFFAQTTQQPLFLWLRWMAGNTLLELHRHHLGFQMRDVRREAAAGQAWWPASGERQDETRDALVAQLTGGATGPATAAERKEAVTRLHEALATIDPVDREVLALRHYEQLTNAEAAQVLGIQERAAGKRYLRALERLRETLAEMPGGLTELRP